MVNQHEFYELCPLLKKLIFYFSRVAWDFWLSGSSISFCAGLILRPGSKKKNKKNVLITYISVFLQVLHCESGVFWQGDNRSGRGGR